MNSKIGKRTTNIFFVAIDGEFCHGNLLRVIRNQLVKCIDFNSTGRAASIPSLAVCTTEFYKELLSTKFFLDIHNETSTCRTSSRRPPQILTLNIQSIVNIHTHLWGAVLFAYLIATFYPTYVQLHGITTWRDSAVIGIFLSSATFCLAASAFYHTSGCHSQKVRHQHGLIVL